MSTKPKESASPAQDKDDDEAQDEGQRASEAPEAPEAPEAAGSRGARGTPIASHVLLIVGLGLPAVLLAANMWHVRKFTVDDSYISYRYARNLVRGLGLVYNVGERIEGYTNFLWTILIAGAIRVGIDPDVFAKVTGALATFGSLGLTYSIAQRLRPFHTLPCVATWLLASSIVFTGYAVFGLETALFTFLLLAGTSLFLRETALEKSGAALEKREAALEKSGTAQEEAPAKADERPFPFSGLVFALAGLTRPEAPMFIGILMLFLGRRFFARQNLLRGVLFTAPVATHLLWRHWYYGAWVPNTLGAKTGNLDGQIQTGMNYVQTYFGHAGPVLYLGIFGAALGIAGKRRDIMAIAAIAAAVLTYVTLIGGDWMYYYRFMAPFEPFGFLMIDLAARDIVDRRIRSVNLAVAAFAIAMFAHRAGSLRTAQKLFLQDQLPFWTTAEGDTSKWLLQHGDPGEIALGDIGYIGYATDYPILDLLGLIDPVISKLPGGYTLKIGPGFTDHLFKKAPKYVLIISSSLTCDQPSVIGSQIIWRDSRFKPSYALAGKVPVGKGFAWCIYKRRPEADKQAQPDSSPALTPASQ